MPINHLLCENRRTVGRIGEDGLVYARTMILRPRLSSPDAGPHRARQLQILRLGEYLHTIRGWLFIFGITARSPTSSIKEIPNRSRCSSPLSQLDRNGPYRRISPVAECLDQSPLTEPAADARPLGWGLLFMPEVV